MREYETVVQATSTALTAQECLGVMALRHFGPHALPLCILNHVFAFLRTPGGADARPEELLIVGAPVASTAPFRREGQTVLLLHEE
eukprot:2380064-Alexandrium_andersonii.AAC.1